MDIATWLGGIADQQLALDKLSPPEFADDDAIPGADGRFTATDPLRVEIDYCDSQGRMTHRPIVIRAVGVDSEVGWVSAYCLLRRALRTFRLERIVGVTTSDGEYLTSRVFFLDRLGVDGGRLPTDFAHDAARRAAYPNDVRAHLRPKLALLVLAARIDGSFHREELDRILIYAERELLAAAKAGRLPVPLSLELLADMEKAVLSMLPDRELVPTYVDLIEKLASDDRRRFWQAFCDVINADAIVSREERMLLAAIERQQLGR